MFAPHSSQPVGGRRQPFRQPLRQPLRQPFRRPAAVLLLTAALAAVLATSLLVTAGTRNTPTQYRYPYPSTPTRVALAALDSAIAIHQQRSQQVPEDGLELAALAGGYLAKARLSGRAHWFLLAEQTARRSLANLPYNNVEAQLVLAEVHEARHDFAAALTLAEEVLRERPGNRGALSLQVTANLARGDVTAAAAAAAALAVFPTPANLGLRALVHLAAGEDEPAQQLFERAIALEEPGDALTSAWNRVQLARLLARSGRYPEARAAVAGALQAVPDYPLALLTQADIDLQLGRYRQAGRHYAAVLERTEGAATTFDHVAWQGQARAAALAGDRPGAERLWREAEAVLRRDLEASAFGHRRELARVLLERGRREDLPEALALLQTETTVRRDPLTLDLLTWALTRAERLDEAWAAVREALQHGNRNPALLARAAAVAEALGRYEEAARWRAELSRVHPTFDERIWRALGLH